MKKSSFRSQWLTLGIALVCLVGSVAINLAREHGRIQRGEEERLLTQSRIVEINTTQNLVAIKQVLMELRKPLHQDTPTAIMNERLKLLADAMPGVRTLLVLDAAGKAISSSQPETLYKNFSHRDYFRTPQQSPDADMLYLSPPFRTVLGVFAVTVTVIVPGPRGEFSGIVTATLDPQYFTGLMSSVLYASDMRAWMLHWRGDVFLAAPERSDVIGANLSQPDGYFTAHQNSGRDASVFTGAAFSAGEERVLVLRTVSSNKLKLDHPLVIATSRDAGAIYAGWRQDVIKQGGLCALIAALSLLALLTFQRRQRESNRQLDEATHALQATHEQIKESEKKYRAVIETTDTGFVILDASGKVSDANCEYVRLSGHSDRKEILGRSPTEWTAEHDRERNSDAVATCLESGYVRNLEIDYIDEHGHITPVEINATTLNQESSLQIVALCRDISERRRSQETINHLAYYDALTNLPNRRLMLERLNLALTQAKRFQRSLAILFMDLDYFKDTNDTLGHAAGDELLKVVAERLRTCVRGGDTVSRQGGDEFVIVLTEIKEAEDVVMVAEKILALMREPVTIQGQQLHFSASIGIALYPAGGTDDPQSLMKKADISMYEAKKCGRDGYQIHRA